MLPEAKFYQYPDDLRKFYNCARTWCVQLSLWALQLLLFTPNCQLCGATLACHCRCAQAGVLDRGNMESSIDVGAKHVKKLPVMLNRLLGMNLQQQQIVFGCDHNTLKQRCVMGIDGLCTL
jgi:hypothetical protein